MIAHVRANVVMVILTMLLCSVLYPLALLAIGQTLFPSGASGSLVNGPDDKPVGSLLIGQNFKSGKYFQSRPSAAGYNASASSGSNLGANNPKLRDRAARQLATIVRYAAGPKKGQLVKDTTDIDDWFKAKSDRTTVWAERYPKLAQAWVDDSSDPVKAWREKYLPKDSEEAFFTAFARLNPGMWPGIETKKVKDEKGEEKEVKEIKPVNGGEDVQTIFFDMWLQERGSADLEAMPADLVTASGSGLDPHITLRGAFAQLDRVVDAWAKETGIPAAEVKTKVEMILKEKTILLLGGLVGEPLINVLEVNLEMKQHLEKRPTK